MGDWSAVLPFNILPAAVKMTQLVVTRDEAEMWDEPFADGQPDRQLAALNGLLELSLAMAGEQDEDRILSIVAEDACRALGCERASLFLFDTDRSELYTRVATRLEVNEIRVPLERGVIGWVARERQIANVPDPVRDARWEGLADRQTGFRTCNILAAPVVARSDASLLGVLQLLNRTGGPFDEFDERLIRAFAEHAGAALERQRMRDATRRNLEYQSALEVGRRIQRSFLPDSLPHVDNYQVASSWEPAEYVSGDYYDCLPLADGRWLLMIADVSGHGLGASLVMASARAMVHLMARSAETINPDEFLDKLDRALRPDLKDGLFLTAIVAVCDPVSHEVEYANAGHQPAMVVRGKTRALERLETTRIPIGFPPIPVSRPPGRFTLESGDSVVLGTDGLFELRNASDELFGSTRFHEMLKRHAGFAAEDMVASIDAELRDYRGCCGNQDDMTLLVWQRQA